MMSGCAAIAQAADSGQISALPFADSDNPNCTSVYATGTGRTVIDCPAGKAFDFCMTRDLVDKAGLITGKVEYFSSSKDNTPHPHDSDSLVLYASETITTVNGTLEFQESGVFNTKTKEFAVINTLMSGSGQFEGYSGKLMVVGYGTNDGEVLWTGKLCQ
jgi:hypothetical protein